MVYVSTLYKFDSENGADSSRKEEKKKKERKELRSQNTELYYARVEILSIRLFLQSVLANLHANTYKTTLTTSTTIVMIIMILILGWRCSSVCRASDRHAADVGSIPRCGMGLFSVSQLAVQTLFRCPYTPVSNRMHLHLCAR